MPDAIYVIDHLLEPGEALIGLLNQSDDNDKHAIVIFKTDKLYARDSQLSIIEPLEYYVRKHHVRQIGIIDTPETRLTVPKLRRENVEELVVEGELSNPNYPSIRRKRSRKQGASVNAKKYVSERISRRKPFKF